MTHSQAALQLFAMAAIIAALRPLFKGLLMMLGEL